MRLLNKAFNRSHLGQWILLGCVLVFLGIIISFNLYVEHERTHARESNRLQAQARVIAENLQHQLALANKALQSASAKIASLKGSSQSAEFQLKVIADSIPGLSHIAIIDARGKLIYSNQQRYIGKNFSHRDYFQTVKRKPSADTLYISAPYKNMLGEYVINVSRMIVGPGGEFSGIVTATLDPEYFKTLMSSALYASDMWDGIAHGDGSLFLMVPGREWLYGTNLAQPGSFFSRHRDSGRMVTIMSGRMRYTNEIRMMVQRTINSPSLKMDQVLVVAVSRDLDMVFQEWRNDALIQAGLYGLINLISIFGFYTYQRKQSILQHQAEAAQTLTNRLRVALDHMQSYIYIKDRQRRYVYANKPTLELFNCSEAELLGSEDSRFFPPDVVSNLHAIDTRVFEQGVDTAQEVVSQDSSGVKRVYWEVKTPIYDETDKTKVWGLCGISTDITELKQREAALQESAKRFHSTFDSAPIGMALVGIDGRFLQANDALCRILGYTQVELQQKTFQEITHPDDLQTDYSMLEELHTGRRESYQIEKRYIHKDGHDIWVLLSRSTVRDSNNKILYLIAQIQDVTERKNLMDKLSLQANQDYLTNLYNRRFFMEQAEVELARAKRYRKPLSLLMLDIDHFKNINDTYGHKSGDIVLQKLSSLLMEKLRTVDVIGRIGGEEFAILLPESNLDNAAEVAERLREDVAKTEVEMDGGAVVHFTVSIGIVVLNDRDINLDAMFNLADQALYKAKNGGRNQVCVAE